MSVLRRAISAFLEQRRQAALVGVGEEAHRVEEQLEAAQHRPTGDRRERADRKAQPPRSLAARRIDEAQLLVGDHQAGEHAGLAQQALEPLMRRSRLPAGERAAAKRLFLNPVGDHPPQQVCREVFRGRAPEYRLPAPPQGIAGQRAHTLDLRLNGGQIDRSLQHGQAACG
jgi:hypothetical protein